MEGADNAFHFSYMQLVSESRNSNYGWTMDGRVTDEARLRQHIVTRTTQSAVDTLTRTSDPDVIR